MVMCHLECCWRTWRIYSLAAVRSLAGKHSLSAAGRTIVKIYCLDSFRKLREQHAIRTTWQERTWLQYGRTGDLPYSRHRPSNGCQVRCREIWRELWRPTLKQRIDAKTMQSNLNNMRVARGTFCSWYSNNLLVEPHEWLSLNYCYILLGRGSMF